MSEYSREPSNATAKIGERLLIDPTRLFQRQVPTYENTKQHFVLIYIASFPCLGCTTTQSLHESENTDLGSPMWPPGCLACCLDGVDLLAVVMGL